MRISDWSSDVCSSDLNPDWHVFLASTVITVAFGGALILSNAGQGQTRLTIRQAFLMTSLSWIAISAFGAIPFLGLGLTYTDALFESISGLTTTGSSVLVGLRSEEHTSELQSLMRISYAVFCLKKKNNKNN